MKKKEFIQNSRNPELTAAVLNQIGLDWKELKERPEDFRDAEAGVSGFIYYSDTVPFAKDNLVLIMNALNEFEQEIGEPLKKPTESETQYYNWLAWFALEHTIDELMMCMEV